MLRVKSPGKFQKCQELQTFINKWEGTVNALERDYHENINDQKKIGILIRMKPRRASGCDSSARC